MKKKSACKACSPRARAQRRWYGREGGCSTRGYEPSQHCYVPRGMKYRRSTMERHKRTLPAFIEHGQWHSTRDGSYHITTICNFLGQLETAVGPVE